MARIDLTARAAYNRAYRLANKERLAEQRRTYVSVNRETVATYNRAWYASHKEEQTAYKRTRYLAYRLANIRKMEANSRRQNAVRKARKLTAPVIEAIDRAIVYERDKGICGICRKPVDSDWHLDHIIPLSRSGEHSYANVQVSHSRCNLSKGATR